MGFAYHLSQNNIHALGITSFYILEHSNEIAIIVKSTKNNWTILQQTIKKHHPYKIPCITKIDVKPNKEFSNWIISSLQKD